MSFIISGAVKGIAGGIGLASEGIHHHKEKKRLQQGNNNTYIAELDAAEPIAESEAEPFTDEVEWQLDEAQDDLLPPPSPEQKDHVKKEEDKTNDSVAVFLNTHPSPPISSPGAKLPHPILLPQRRPKDRSRGFVRAYPPSISSLGISQTEWLSFLDLFNASTQASPWIQTLNLATFATSFLPHGISLAITIAVKIATDVVIEGQSRSRTSSFLEKFNDEYFRPRGLYVLVMTWKPESPDQAYGAVNMESTIHKSINTPAATDLGRKLQRRFRSSDGKTYGDLGFLETAPLIFPALDSHAIPPPDAPQNNNNNALTKPSSGKLSRSKAFVNDYLDRRAQATYAMENPNSALTKGQPTPKFSSRFAQPDHPSNSGHPIALVTGGKFEPEMLGGGGGLGGGRGGGMGGRGGLLGGGGRGGSSETSLGSRGRGGGLGGLGRGGAGGSGGLSQGIMGLPTGGEVVKKVLGKDVLYLMVVSMPTDEEMDEARRVVDSMT